MKSIAVTAAGGETLATLAAKLAAVFAADSTIQSLGITVESDPVAGKIDFTWSGPLSNYVTLSASASPGAETFTVVQFSGGSGPVIPLRAFSFVFGPHLIQLVQNRRRSMDNAELLVLIAAAAGSLPVM